MEPLAEIRAISPVGAQHDGLRRYAVTLAADDEGFSRRQAASSAVTPSAATARATTYKVDTHGRLIGAPQTLTDLAWGAVMTSAQHAQHCPSVTVRVPAEMVTGASLQFQR